LLALGVALSVAVFLGIVSASDASVRSFERGALALGGAPALEVESSTGDLHLDALGPALRALSREFQVVPVYGESPAALLPPPGSGKPARVWLVARHVEEDLEAKSGMVREYLRAAAGRY